MISIVSLLLLLSCVYVTQAQQRYSVDEFSPENFAPYADTVQFFYLVAAFPYNAPSNIVESAGDTWNSFSASHGGLGVWNVATNEKISIEFVSNNYVGTLMPNLDPNRKALSWNNSGSIVITSPLVENDWNRATVICTSSGVTFSELYDWIQNEQGNWDTYQPVSVFAPTTGYNVPPVNNVSDIKLSPMDSYGFVNTLINQLNSYGAGLESFLENLGASVFAYEIKTGYGIVAIDNNEDVYNWYAALESCYKGVLNNSASAVAFLSAVQVCYYASPMAYVYKSSSQVYAMQLTNFSDPQYNTPRFFVFAYSLPDALVVHFIQLNAVDIATIVVLLLLVLLSIRWFVINRMLLQNTRKKDIDAHGELVAEQTVQRINEDDTMRNTSLDADYYYYNAKRATSMTFKRLTTYKPNRTWFECCFCIDPDDREGLGLSSASASSSDMKEYVSSSSNNA